MTRLATGQRIALPLICLTALLSAMELRAAPAEESPAPVTVQRYRYDAGGRLVAQELQSGPGAAESFELDAAGNRTKAVRSQGAAPKRFTPSVPPAAMQAILSILLED